MVMEHVCSRADQLMRAKLFDYIQRKNLLDFGKFNQCIIAGNHVTKIISCLVNTSSWQGIKQLGISCGFILILFAYESSYGHVHNSQAKSPSSSALNSWEHM